VSKQTEGEVMKDYTNAEVHVLNRVMYLLEETSVDSLVKEDNKFALFVDQLYLTVQNKAEQLQQNVV
jgi:hypothetical protein